MIQAYIVTEGQFDANLLKRLLSAQLEKNVVFVVGAGSSDAQSLARSILAVKHRAVALVLDADTVDIESIKERVGLNQDLLRYASAGTPFKVFLAVPTIEIILFQDRALLEQLTQHKFTDVEWAQAEFVPGVVLRKALGQNAQVIKLDDLIQRLTGEMIDKLRTHQLILDLSQFLVEVTAMQPVI
jgi:FlaA1/EpsC-like NDP-sugar epimerase